MERNDGDSDNQHPVDSHHPHPCSSCGWNGAAPSNLMKRQSPPSSPSPHPEPRIKKLFLDQDENLSSRGYSKISLPFPFGASSSSSTVRKSTQSCTLSSLRPGVSHPSQAIAIFNAGTASLSALPPLPKGLRRPISNSNPSSPGKTFSQSPTKAHIGTELMKAESPESKQLKALTERLREANQYLSATLREQEQEDRATKIKESFVDNNGDSEESCEAEVEETVAIESSGESFIIRFICPCGKIYKILLSGDNCFYKLI